MPGTQHSCGPVPVWAAPPRDSRGFPLVANLTMETENGFLTLHSTSKSQCPPIPTPKILVPEKALEQFLAAHTQTYETAREAPPEQRIEKHLSAPYIGYC